MVFTEIHALRIIHQTFREAMMFKINKSAQRRSAKIRRLVKLSTRGPSGSRVYYLDGNGDICKLEDGVLQQLNVRENTL